MEAADPLRNGRCRTDPLLPRKQHLQTSQTTIQRPAGKRYGPHGGVGRRTVPYDPQQYAQADLSRAYGRLLPLLPGRCGGQLPLRRLPVKKATTLATIFPGAGQVYNKSYWKLPFVVGGLATTIYTIDWNNRGYKRFKKAYSDRSAYDKALEEHQKDPEHHPDPPVAKGEFGTKYSAEFLKNLKDNYRRNRDLCIIITAGLYVLQIIDAHVDAHLKSYDISDDLSVEFTPAVNYVYSRPPADTVRPSDSISI